MFSIFNLQGLNSNIYFLYEIDRDLLNYIWGIMTGK